MAKGGKDLIWRDITNPEEGILSPRYRKAFFPELRDEKKYNGLYQKLYRELSEYVHGNALTVDTANIIFSQKKHDGMLDKFNTYITVAHVILGTRYLQEISNQGIAALDPTLRLRASQIESFIAYLDDKALLVAANSNSTSSNPPPPANGENDTPTTFEEADQPNGNN